jgi:glycosyltransferase involved in cell wall biosynthesis
MPVEVSFVIPAYNEAASLEELGAAVEKAGISAEVIVVDDGSTDGTASFAAIRFAANRGKSAAVAAGFAAARGRVVVLLDADLQNDPADAPRLLAALEDADLACGVRTARHDSRSKRWASRLANGFRRFVVKDRFRDVGCGFQAWRRDAALKLPRFDGFHRWAPVLAEIEGFTVVEVEVAHRPRLHGRSHYGNFGRAWRGVTDLFGVTWLRRRRLGERGRAACDDAPGRRARRNGTTSRERQPAASPAARDAAPRDP